MNAMVSAYTICCAGEVFSQRNVFTAQSQNLSLGGMLLEGSCDLSLLAQRKAETVLLSWHGCLLLTDAAPGSNALLTIHWPDTGAVTSARVVSKEEDTDGMFKMALAFIDDANFWGIDFAAEGTKLHCLIY